MDKEESYQKLLAEVKQNCIDSRIPLTYQEEVFLQSGFNHGWETRENLAKHNSSFIQDCYSCKRKIKCDSPYKNHNYKCERYSKGSPK